MILMRQKIHLEVNPYANLSNIDIRLGIQASDDCGTSEFGTAVFTPWASEGGGKSDYATDLNGVDPDSYRIIIQTRDMPPVNFKSIVQLRIGLSATDAGGKENGPYVLYTLDF